MDRLTTEDVKCIRAVYIKGDHDFGAMALAKKYDVPVTAIEMAIRGKTWERFKRCERCGVVLGKWQKRWCRNCNEIIGRESTAAKRKKRGAYQKDTPVNDCEYLEWEAAICLNCKRPTCNDCLSGKTNEQKQAMLKMYGGT